MGKFTNNIPFTDSADGFYGALRTTFATLATEEEEACDWEGIEPYDYPDFGVKADDYDLVVKPFYAAWAGFSTRKTFAWKDVHNYADAPDRRIRRLMEKENKRLREEAIRDYNDTVRTLVSFAKKRDPRYTVHLQTDADRQKALRDATAAQAARARAAHQAKLDEHVIPSWAQSTARDDNEGGFTDSEEEVVEEFECVVCDKTFKSEKQIEAHEKSKKHIKAVHQLKKQMRKDNQLFDLEHEQPASSGMGSEADEYEDAKEEREDVDREAGSAETDGADDIAPAAQYDGAEEETVMPLGPVGSQDEVVSAVDNEKEDGSSDSESEPGPPGESPGVNSDDGGDLADDLQNLSVEDKTKAQAEAKVGKAKARRAKKAAKQEAADQHICAMCQASFPSKTKLFNHIKEEDHAQPVPAKDKNSKKKKGRK
jgi:DnaJ family protein A protein 5